MAEDASPTSPAPPEQHPHAAPAPVRAGLRLLLPLGVVLLLLALVAGGAAAGLRWLLGTEAGSSWLLQRLPFLEVRGWKGALLGDEWQAERIRVPWAKGQQWVLLEDFKAEGLKLAWRPHEHAWVDIQAQQLSASNVHVETGPPGPRPIVLARSIAAPVQIHADRVLMERFSVGGMQWQRVLGEDVLFDPRPGARYVVKHIVFDAWGVHIDGGFAIGNAAPLPLQAQATVVPGVSADEQAPRWAAVLRASGNVPELALAGTLRGVPLAGHEAPAVDLQLGLRPLQAWMLGSLKLDTQALDLSALAPQLPATRLAGQAELAGGSAGQPLAAKLNLTNALPGRWNEGRLPLHALALEVQGQREKPERVEIGRFELALADATREAGRWSGSGLWQGHELKLETRLAGVNPQRLDSRAAALTLTGPAAFTLRGLPSPDRSATGVPPPPRVEWKVDLQGKLDAAPQPVQLLLEGSADDQRMELKRARAQSGAASAEFNASLVRAGRGDWQLASAGTLTNFDPLPWWPGDAGGAWRQGPHRLSGGWQLDLRLPGNAERLPALALAQRLVGNGELRIADSQLAGVPLSADVQLAYAPSRGAEPASLKAELVLGGNQLLAEGHGDPTGSGQADRWRVDLKAENLSALAPLTKLHPALAEWVPRQGSANAVLAAEGRWPEMRTEGNLRVSQLQAGSLALARGSANWRMDLRDQQSLALQAELAGVAMGAQRADHLRADLRGTLARHRIEISGALPVVPPPLAEQMLGIQAQSGTRALLQAEGEWQPAAGGGGRWSAHVERLIVGAWDGSVTNAPPASGWAEAHDLRARLDFDASRSLVALQADAGRLALADTATLRWDEVQLDLRGERAQIKLHADIEPFALAPLLARAQPTMGWQGDLRLTARVDIQAAEKVDADLVFERKDGDLHVAAGEAMQLLGLSEFRVAISAHDGLWNFSPAFRGRSLGSISGQLRARTTPDRRWPHDQAPVEGQLQAQVADIGIWSAWVPAGWRLVGALNTTATISGTWGNPQFTGELSGSGLGVRNLLQGVNVSEGQVLMKLEGDSARIERFTLKAGDGTATVTGGATLGREPQARLLLKADHLRVLGRVDRQVIASGNAEINATKDLVNVQGRFKLDEGLIDFSRSDAPTLDDDVTVRRPGAPVEERTESGAPKTQRKLQLAVDLDLGDELHLRGRGLETGLRGQLSLTTPGGRLAVNGTISALGGTYRAYGQKLTIERGIVAFSGAADNPRLDVLALRPNLSETRVGVLVTGNALTPRVRLWSDPEMSESDKLSWLVLGRAPDGLGRNDTALLQRAAVALLAGEGEAPTDALMHRLGIDEISLRQSEGDVRETVISLGKQVSNRLYVGYERGVNSTTGTWQLIYRIAQRFTLRAQSGLENALDVIWTWRAQETPANAGMRKSTVTPP